MAGDLRTGLMQDDDKKQDAESETAAHPMDTWLKEQLGTLHADVLSEDLPDELDALTARLQRRLSTSDEPAEPSEGGESAAPSRSRPGER